MLLKFNAATDTPAHSVTFATVLTVGWGLTVMTYDELVPGQPFRLGVTLMVPVIAVLPLLVLVKPSTLPAPAAARPIAVLVFVQL